MVCAGSFDLSTLPDAAGLQAMWEALTAPRRNPTVADVTAEVAAQFGGKTPAVLVGDPDFGDTRQKVCDTILLIFVLPPNTGPILELSRLLLVIELIERVAADYPAIRQRGAVAAALSLTLLLQPDIFPSSPTPVRPAGWGDLLIVKEHIKGYERGEVSYRERVAD